MKTAMELAAAIEGKMATLDDDDLDACAWLSDILAKTEPMPTPRRIAITVSGGVAEFADAENWPEGLELYIVDYDCYDTDEEELSQVDGPCTISTHTGPDGNMTGHFASKVAEAWQHD